MVYGVVAPEVRITTLVYKTDTFFQYGLEKKLELSIATPIVGVKIKGMIIDC